MDIEPKKEPLGTMKNAGQTYRPKGKPTKVTTHDFPDRKLGKAVPYGVYDIALNLKKSVDPAKSAKPA